jgi:hypothetical protein
MYLTRYDYREDLFNIMRAFQDSGADWTNEDHLNTFANSTAEMYRAKHLQRMRKEILRSLFNSDGTIRGSTKDARDQNAGILRVVENAQELRRVAEAAGIADPSILSRWKYYLRNRDSAPMRSGPLDPAEDQGL